MIIQLIYLITIASLCSASDPTLSQQNDESRDLSPPLEGAASTYDAQYEVPDYGHGHVPDYGYGHVPDYGYGHVHLDQQQLVQEHPVPLDYLNYGHVGLNHAHLGLIKAVPVPVTAPHVDLVHHDNPVPHDDALVVEHKAEIPVPVVRHVPVAVPVPVPQPYPVPVPHPVGVPVPKPYPVHVETRVPYPVIKWKEVIVERKVPYPVEKLVPYPVEKEVLVEKEVPVPITVLKTVHHHHKGFWHKW